MSPISTNLNIRLWDAAVTDEEPEAKDGFGKDVKNGVCKNLRVDGRLAGTVGEAPHTDTNVSLTSTTNVQSSGSVAVLTWGRPSTG